MTQRDGFESVFTDAAPSTRLPEIFRAGFPDLPDWARTFSFVPAAALADLGRLLGLGPGSVFLDVACGMGGPGQIAADVSGARLVGADFALPAINGAAGVARRRGIDATWVAASGHALPFASGSFDAVMCIDAIRFIPDFGLPDIWRVLRPGGRFGMTAWERPAQGSLPSLADIPGVLSSAGFHVEHVSRHDDWLDAQDAVYAAAQAARDQGVTDPAVIVMAEEGDAVKGQLERGRRVMAVAVKPT